MKSILVFAVALIGATAGFAQHEHGGSGAAPSKSRNDTCCEIVDAYLPVSEALAADDLPKARAAAAALARQADGMGLKGIAGHARAAAEAGSISAARNAFKAVSDEITPMVAGAKEYVVMNCPMANADWVQKDAKVRNPYYGKMMLTCGAPKNAPAK